MLILLLLLYHNPDLHRFAPIRKRWSHTGAYRIWIFKWPT